MRFLIDEQLPPALVAWLQNAGHDATHVRDVGLKRGSDVQIAEWALTNRAVVLSKDEDFAALALRTVGLRVVWIRFGNLPNEALFVRFGGMLDAACARLDLGDLIVELR